MADNDARKGPERAHYDNGQQRQVTYGDLDFVIQVIDRLKRDGEVAANGVGLLVAMENARIAQLEEMLREQEHEN